MKKLSLLLLGLVFVFFYACNGGEATNDTDEIIEEDVVENEIADTEQNASVQSAVDMLLIGGATPVTWENANGD